MFLTLGKNKRPIYILSVYSPAKQELYPFPPTWYLAYLNHFSSITSLIYVKCGMVCLRLTAPMYCVWAAAYTITRF